MPNALVPGFWSGESVRDADHSRSNEGDAAHSVTMSEKGPPQTFGRCAVDQHFNVSEALKISGLAEVAWHLPLLVLGCVA